MKRWKEMPNSIVLCVVELVTGILLLLNPVKFTSAVIIGAGVVLVVLGGIAVVKYFRASPEEASLGQMLARGLISILAGGFCIFRWEWFLATFPALSIVYGVAILLTGIRKIQITVDMLRLKRQKWIWSAADAAISMIGAIVILCSPFASTAVLWTFTGATLVVEGLFDLVVIILCRRAKGEDEL